MRKKAIAVSLFWVGKSGFGAAKGRQLVMRMSSILLIALVTLAGSTARTDEEIPAFPGAEGFGSHTPGGRGGRVIEVTNLNADGPGSLKAAVDAKGARIVIFRVSGVIHLERKLNIREPFITIAGQTAPGDGICLRGAYIWIGTHDVIIRQFAPDPH